MTTLDNSFRYSEFKWTPSAAADSVQVATLGRFEGTGAVGEEALRFELDDQCVTDFVVTAECVGPKDAYFCIELRGTWFREGSTMTVMAAPSSSRDFSENAFAWDARLDFDDEDIVLVVRGEGEWTIAANRLITVHDRLQLQSPAPQ